MKICMSKHFNDECDHFVLLTVHCRRCEALYQRPAMRFLRRLTFAVSICAAAIRSAI